MLVPSLVLSSTVLYKKLTNVNKSKAKSFVSIAAALFCSFGVCKVILSLFYYIASALLQFLPVMILEDLVKYFETINTANPHKTLLHPWVEVAGLGLLPLCTSILQTWSQTIFQHGAVFVRTAISTLLYEKSECIGSKTCCDKYGTGGQYDV